MKISELKTIVREAVEEVANEMARQNISENEIADFRKHMTDRLRKLPKYKGASQGTIKSAVDKMVAAWQGGDKRIAEMWMGWEGKGKMQEGASIAANVVKDELQKLVQMAAQYKLSHKVEPNGHVVFSGDQGQLDAFVNHALESDLDVAFDDKLSEHDETDLSNPEESREVQLAKQLQDLVNKLLVMHGVGEEEASPEGEEATTEEPAAEEPLKEVDEAPEGEEANTEDPAENEEVEIARQIKSIANQILAMHGVTDEEQPTEEPTSEEPAQTEEPEKKGLQEKKLSKKKKKVKKSLKEGAGSPTRKLRWEDGLTIEVDAAGNPVGMQNLGYANSGIHIPQTDDWRRFFVSGNGNLEKFVSPKLKVWYSVDSSG